MAEASTEIPGSSGNRDLLEPGTHAAYFFDSQSEKQLRLFSLCSETVDQRKASLVYIAGKQGVKGIRLSLKDTGFDVSAYEKRSQMKILDSEEFFLTVGRQQQFRPVRELCDKITSFESEGQSKGFNAVVVLCETDMLVRKGFSNAYADFEEAISGLVRQSQLSFVCAFDRRELLAKGISNPEAQIGPLHDFVA
jgi:hypothetical protein